MKKSRIVRLTSALSLWNRISTTLTQDRVSVYAAQASFFVIISTVPFASLLLTILQYILPDRLDSNWLADIFGQTLPASLIALGESLLKDVSVPSTVSLLSISALTILWAASRGIGAIREGIQTVYEAPYSAHYFQKVFRSLLYTICFVVLIILVTVILVFGEFLYSFMKTQLGLELNLLDAVLRYRIPFFFIFLTMIFTLLYVTVARKSEKVNNRILCHLPGAVFASLGWIVYSWIYSLYIAYNSNSSYVYGGLAALCLIMLWLYFCMIILLWGAEINKLFFAGCEKRLW